MGCPSRPQALPLSAIRSQLTCVSHVTFSPPSRTVTSPPEHSQDPPSLVPALLDHPLRAGCPVTGCVRLGGRLPRNVPRGELGSFLETLLFLCRASCFLGPYTHHTHNTHPGLPRLAGFLVAHSLLGLSLQPLCPGCQAWVPVPSAPNPQELTSDMVPLPE